MRMKKPIARTVQENRCEKHPKLKNTVCSFVRSFSAILWPIPKDFSCPPDGIFRKNLG